MDGKLISCYMTFICFFYGGMQLKLTATMKGASFIWKNSIPKEITNEISI